MRLERYGNVSLITCNMYVYNVIEFFSCFSYA